MALIGTDILKAAAILKQNALVAIPTETVYGLAGNALNADAVTKIFETKNRPSFDPLIVHIHQIDEVTKYTPQFHPTLAKLAEAFWPGPLTVLVPRREIIPDLVCSGLPQVALRVPAHPLTLALLKSIDFPLAAPSANPFGYISPTMPQHVAAQLGDKIDYILDGGPCRVGIESSIVGMEDDELCMYRLGGISKEEIEQVAGQQVLIKSQVQEKVLAPGQLSSHYAPDKKMILGDIAYWLANTDPKEVGILSFSKIYDEVEESRQIQLSVKEDLREAAQNLFAALRILDNMPVTTILAEPLPDIGLGRAINDRLKRAAVGKAD
ncbi:MAG TPA: L-threonylcarbamoyladenylate synthase [Cyclobacteriaceae bacterium]|nr:L-threonylcarbamoyladenylate synthase [Cyclobacteriaceae bacterium]